MQLNFYFDKTYINEKIYLRLLAYETTFGLDRHFRTLNSNVRIPILKFPTDFQSYTNVMANIKYGSFSFFFCGYLCIVQRTITQIKTNKLRAQKSFDKYVSVRDDRIKIYWRRQFWGNKFYWHLLSFIENDSTFLFDIKISMR